MTSLQLHHPRTPGAVDMPRGRRSIARPDDAGLPPIVRATVLTSLALLGALGAWAAVGTVRQTAVTTGQVVPSGDVRSVQHLEGGIVADLLVREGEVVDKGQPLVLLEPVQALSERDQLRARQIGLELKAERLRAFIEDRPPQFPAGVDPGLVRDQRIVLDAQTSARTSALEVLARQIEQRKTETAVLRDQLDSVESQLRFIREEVAIRAALEAKGLVSRLTYIDTLREEARLAGERDRLAGQIPTAEQALAEAEGRYVDQRMRFAQQAADEMATTTAELAQVRELRANLEDRVRRLTITAPARGIVHDLRIKTLGGVVEAGGIVLDLVPAEETLLAETQVSPRDIGQLSPGQEVAVKLSTYDYARYGTIPGRLVELSPTTFLDPDGHPYFRARIELQSSHVEKDGVRLPILPGMTVEADIVTGERTLAEYLLRPVYVALGEAFREQ